MHDITITIRHIVAFEYFKKGSECWLIQFITNCKPWIFLPAPIISSYSCHFLFPLSPLHGHSHLFCLPDSSGSDLPICICQDAATARQHPLLYMNFTTSGFIYSVFRINTHFPTLPDLIYVTTGNPHLDTFLQITLFKVPGKQSNKVWEKKTD